MGFVVAASWGNHILRVKWASYSAKRTVAAKTAVGSEATMYLGSSRTLMRGARSESFHTSINSETIAMIIQSIDSNVPLDKLRDPKD